MPLVTLLAATRLEAIATVDRFVAAWHERHEGFLATLAADCRVHWSLRSPFAGVARSAASALPRRFARRTAVGASARLVREAFFGVKLLFASGEREGLVAIAAGQALVGIHDVP